MNRDWGDHDFYGTLEVTLDVDAAGLKRAYRRMAQRHHPDANPGDPRANERFRMIALAYGVLSDPVQRDLYDRLRAGETAAEARAAQQPAEEVVGAAAAGAILGRHIITSASLTLEQAVRGAAVTVTLDNGAELSVTLPPAVDDGDIIRLEGRGHQTNDTGKAGDLIVIVHVPRHQVFERDDLDLTAHVPITLSGAAMGGDFEVPTLNGPVTITVPPGTPIGSRFRIEGHGISKPGERTGDLYVVVEAHSNDTMRDDAMRGSFAGLVDVLDRDMEVIPTVGHVFNPELHEAVRVAEAGDGTLMVTGEVRRGYVVKGQVIRPALVTVAYAAKQLEEGDPT